MMRSLLSFLVVLAVAGCDRVDPASPEGDNRSAEGQVQGGTISDAMLPLDTVTSTPPPVRETARPAQDRNTDDAVATEDDGDVADGSASPDETETSEPVESDAEE